MLQENTSKNPKSKMATDRKPKMEAKQQNQQLSCPSPLPNPPSSLLKDISNFKTPKHPSQQNPNFHSPFPQFFTASKQTPQSLSSSLRRHHHRPSLAQSRSKAARKLMAVELEQSKSARKALIHKEKSLKSLAKSLTVWLNFLFEDPKSCGCDITKLTREDRSEASEVLLANGKRDSWPDGGVGIDREWRKLKRQRNLSWRDMGDTEMTSQNLMFSGLRYSLREVCSFDDLKERMRVYLSLGSCKEIFDVMTQVTKNIDEGRLKMKAHCPIETDVGMKENAIRLLMCYNPMWLRIGLYIIFGGDSLLPNGDINSEQEIAFLRMVIEKQFFTHAGLAKAYAYNKLVEGLYRPGYFEKLGNIILKRFLLLVIILDRAKSHSSLPINYGIDGSDGGSPLLFTLQSNIKSSRQVISDFLSSDVMHGEGNLLAHLMIFGYKVSYQQSLLIEYDFRVTDLFEDLRDGVRLCRAIQLLQHDSSILMKMVVPSDTRKKNLVNCGTALQHLKQANVPLYDEDGTVIVGEDVVNGDKELTLSLLWNIFVHLQLPLLINKKLLAEEISKIRRVDVEHINPCALLDMLLNWIQAICESYDFRVDNFASLVDGKAMWCLLDYYFRTEHHCCCSFKDPNETNREASIMSASDYSDAVHNFILSQKLTSILGNFPEVLQVSDILEHNGACNERSVAILLVFLSFQLIVKRNTDQLNFHKLLGFSCQRREKKHLSTELWFVHSEALLNRGETHGNDTERNFKAIMTWWQEMAQGNSKYDLKPATPILQCFSTGRQSINIQRENAAKIIQSHFRRSSKYRNFLRIRNAVAFLQTAIRAWLTAKKKSAINKFSSSKVKLSSYDRWKHTDTFGRYMIFIVDRHNFVKLRSSVVIIQRATRAWISRQHHCENMFIPDMSTLDLSNTAVVIQKCIRGWKTRSIYSNSVAQVKKASIVCIENKVTDLQMKAAFKIQIAWKKFVLCKSLLTQHSAATKIQNHCRGWLVRKNFRGNMPTQDMATPDINAAIVIQKCICGWKTRSIYSDSVAYEERDSIACKDNDVNDLQMKAAFKIQVAWKKIVLCKSLLTQHSAATKIQSNCRGWLVRKKFVKQKQAIITIQSIFQCMKCRRAFEQFKLATRSAIIIQSRVRGLIVRRRAYRHRCLILMIQSHCRGWLVRRDLLLQMKAAIRIQSAFRRMKCSKAFRYDRHAVIEIQSFVRGRTIRKRLLGASCLHKAEKIGYICRTLGDCLQSIELQIFFHSVFKLQRWWKSILLLKLRTKSAIIIQSHIRGWIARQGAARERHRVVVIQSFWKGYLARKDSREQLLDLRLRMQKSAANVDDGMRIINRLVAALSELLNMRSVSGILHTCATLDMATAHSQKCCEKLVDAGAVDTLLKLICSVSRSIPDQEVLKHALSTLRNLARYPHLTELLIDSRGSVKTILSEFIRNKEEGYFIASELLEKICLNQRGLEAVRNLPALLKRLHTLVEDLTRKAGNVKRNAWGLAGRENTERRLRVAVELLKLITNG